mmetsp:Transcript_963/g.2182  ORF Transcript_963/g.2182 Transcript_963/m.2182 type:complete len:591 (+) Transcript_963:2-1774(+)
MSDPSATPPATKQQMRAGQHTPMECTLAKELTSSTDFGSASSDRSTCGSVDSPDKRGGRGCSSDADLYNQIFNSEKEGSSSGADASSHASTPAKTSGFADAAWMNGAHSQTPCIKRGLESEFEDPGCGGCLPMDLVMRRSNLFMDVLKGAQGRHCPSASRPHQDLEAADFEEHCLVSVMEMMLASSSSSKEREAGERKACGPLRRSLEELEPEPKCSIAPRRLAEWPDAVWDTLSVQDIVEKAAQIVTPAATQGQQVLRLVGAGCSIPHPEKGDQVERGKDVVVRNWKQAETAGADSFFIDTSSNCMGVADGVGEWEVRFKCSARAFADELMDGCRAASREVAESKKDNTMGLEAVAQDILRQGHSCTRSFGASTGIVAKLGSETSSIGVACLGDSVLLHLRPEKKPEGSNGQHTSLRSVSRTREQQHAFNCPFQLSRLPIPEDFPRLLSEGKTALVRAVQSNRRARLDEPEDAETYEFQVQRGDLLIMGTDGVFDNLYDEEICSLASCAVNPFQVPGLAGAKPTGEEQHPLEEELAARLAAALARAAYLRSTTASSSSRTPFSDHAEQAGKYHPGGKMDDITCVCAWVA